MDLRDSIFSVSNERDFEQVALKVFEYQKEHCSIYRDYVNSLNWPTPTNVVEIPFLPISFFKTHKVCQEGINPELVFKSSGTTGQTRSQHFVQDAQIYKDSFFNAYRLLIGDPENQVILALLPNYIEQGESSLVYMVDHLIAATNNTLSGFLLNSPSEVKLRYHQALESGKKVVIFGVSYALLDLAEQNVDLSKALIIETGGMKGRRSEITKAELHQQLRQGLNVPFIASEYGMTELLSQGYSNANGLFETPPWMKVQIREVNDPFTYLEDGKTGGINVIDLANLYSCSFIATQDLGRIIGNEFEIMGRFDNADIRGCNLLLS